MTKTARHRHTGIFRLLVITLAVLAIFGFGFLVASCTDVWGALDNPADPTGSNYQGFETVKVADAIVTVSTSTNYTAASATLLATKVINAQAYHFQVASSAAFSGTDLLYNSDTLTSNSCVAVGLPKNVALQWRVRARTGLEWGVWSPTSSFSLLSPPPLVIPADGGTVSSAKPTFTWQAVEGAESYELVLAQSEAALPSAIPVNVSGTNWTPSSNLASGTWYWRMRSLDAWNHAGEWSATRSFTKPILIGDSGPAGGVVFYDKGSYSSGWRYLEAWTSDESGYYQWKTSNTSTSGTSTAIGSGYTNTYTAMAGTAHPAAQRARNATYGGYTDWFLPSKDELNLMYGQKGVIGGFASVLYWSSSEYGSNYAWSQYFGNGYQDYYGKADTRRVRVVRAF
jgi:hypothetical protein